MLVLGFLAYLMKENGFPVAPTILGIVMELLVERNFVISLIKADGTTAGFVERPIAVGLALLAAVVWATPAILWLRRRRTGRAGA